MRRKEDSLITLRLRLSLKNIELTAKHPLTLTDKKNLNVQLQVDSIKVTGLSIFVDLR